VAVCSAVLTLAVATSLAEAEAGASGPGSRSGAGQVENVDAHERIGTSVQGRGIFAHRMGNDEASIKAVVIGNMHGDEPAGVQVARSIIARGTVRHIDLWVVPTMNPDGLAAHTRQNAHGVDLNRNWRHLWVRQTGRYDSGPYPFSEPESRAMRAFLLRVDPDFVVSLHQPLHGVDSDHPKNPRLMNRLAANLGLAKKPFTCGTGVCHGTMTGWFNAQRPGACITVEFGPSPRQRYLSGRAAHGVVQAVLGRY
jgi:protein MpaA